MPGIGKLSAIRAWTGFSGSNTETKLPLIGPCQGRERLYLATGHKGLVTTSLATGQLLIDQIVGRDSAIPTIYRHD